MPTAEALTNCYCTLDDVVTELNKSDSPNALFQARAHKAINEASRLIDDYCETNFYKQDFSTTFYDLRYKDHVKESENLYLFLPLASITSIEEDDTILTANQYVLDGLARLIRVDATSGDPRDWGSKVRIKAKFGYLDPNACSASGWSSLPSVIRKQCAVMSSYLMGERVFNDSSESETDSLVKSGFENKTMSNIAGSGSGTATASPKSNPSNLYYFNQASTDLVIAMKLPIDSTETRTKTKTSGSSLNGLIPVYEFSKLDPYRFLRF